MIYYNKMNNKNNTNIPITTIVNALEYYDLNTEKYKNIFKNIKYISLIDDSTDMGHSIIEMYDSDEKKIFSSRYEIIGLYNQNTSMWIWSWSVPILNKNSIYTSKKLINYGIELDPEFVNLKAELITSRFIISNPIQLDIHLALASYLSKNPVIYKYTNIKENILTKQKMKDTTFKGDSETNIDYYLFLLDHEQF
jgi:hypothetical protein